MLWGGVSGDLTYFPRFEWGDVPLRQGKAKRRKGYPCRGRFGIGMWFKFILKRFMRTAVRVWCRLSGPALRFALDTRASQGQPCAHV
ncbi:hypothetical protein SAMN04488527_12619 [Aliiroseovarius crassostreae]|nr:hypothetical protein SAMN04488527_12619 [Aliiroseovarius crassostreae]